MEQVLERVYPATNEKGEYYLYDDEGNGVTNQRTLRSIAEGQELIAEWERRIERTGMAEALRRYYEGDDELDPEEED